MTSSTALPAHTDILIIGAGEAGVRVASTLRELGDERSILLVSDEPHQPYQRPPLSKAFLDGSADHDVVSLRAPEYYSEAGIEYRLNCPFSRVEVSTDGSGHAQTASGETVTFSRLVLSTGARARSLPIAGSNLLGVRALRSMHDAEGLRDELARAQRVVVLGAGYIGLEAAAVASSRGIHTTVIEREGRLLSRVSAKPLSDFLLAQHRGWGVDFELRAEVSEIVGEGGRVTGVQLADGRMVPADLVIVGVGAVPETGLASKIGLNVERGIVVDSAGRTSHPEVLAAGDCTVSPHPHKPGQLLGMESVQNANDQARAVAATIAGTTPPAPPVPWFWSDQRDLKLQIAGIADGHDQVTVRGDTTSDHVTVLYYRQGRLIASESVNQPKDFLAVKRALRDGKTIPSDAATDTDVLLKSLIV